VNKEKLRAYFEKRIEELKNEADDYYIGKLSVYEGLIKKLDAGEFE
jgi:hypothetical protein